MDRKTVKVKLASVKTVNGKKVYSGNKRFLKRSQRLVSIFRGVGVGSWPYNSMFARARFEVISYCFRPKASTYSSRPAQISICAQKCEGG